MQFLVNDSPEACIVAAQKLFPKEWGYKGTFYTKGNHVWFKEAETVGENFKDFARVMVLSVLTLGIYFVYLNLTGLRSCPSKRGRPCTSSPRGEPNSLRGEGKQTEIPA